MHRLLDHPDAKAAVQEIIKNKDVTERYLSKFKQMDNETAVGPYKIGEVSITSTTQTWKKVAGHYANAFQAGNKIFPYFTTLK